MNPEISIIIPVYNVEQYLRRCLDSCINQTFKNIEIIAVNDCSPDNSASIMKEYEKKYPQIMRCVYLNKNLRQGGARNKGIDIARGKYILFVDSDDWIAENMCEEMINSIKSNDADIAICDYYRFKDAECTHESAFRATESISDRSDIDKEFILRNHLKNFSVNKIFKKELFDKYDLRYPEGMAFEDVAVIMLWVLYADKINYINIPLYYYYMRDDSTVSSLNNLTYRQNYIKSLIIKIELLNKHGFWNLYNDYLSENILEEMTTVAYSNAFFHTLEETDFFNEFVKKHILNIEDRIHKHNNLSENDKIVLKSYFKYSGKWNKMKVPIKSKLDEINNPKAVTAIWGLGVVGKQFIEYLKLFDFTPNCIIESNKKLQGTFFQNIPITSLDEVKNSCDNIIIAVSKEKFIEEIEKQIRSCNPKISIKKYIEYIYLVEGV